MKLINFISIISLQKLNNLQLLIFLLNIIVILCFPLLYTKLKLNFIFPSKNIFNIFESFN